MQTLHGKRVLVTGAASGIGKALAAEFAARGAEVLLADRDEAGAVLAARELSAAGRRASGHACDVTDPASIGALRERVLAQGGPVDVLVNNAGVVFGGAFLDVPVERHLATYDVNTRGVAAVTHAFLPDLLGRLDAHVVNVASASGYVGLPFGATYASSKWAVIGFSESLALELELLGHDHVHITTVCPSYVATGMFDGVKPPLTTQLLTPERLAAQVVRAVLRNAAKVRAPWLVALTPFLKGVLPNRLFVRAAGFLGVNTSMMHWRGRAAAPRPDRRPDEPPRSAAGAAH